MMAVTRVPIAAGLIGLALVAAGWPTAGEAAPLPPDAAKVAQDFLFAFSRNDREAIKRMLPESHANLFGPCPFDRMPQLTKPRADGRVAAVDFAARATDPNLPERGLIVLRLVEEGGSRTWRVRQVYWFNELPREADLPERSRTEADRRQEPAVRQAALEFLRAWLGRKWERMHELTFRWWEVPRREPRWVKMTHVDVAGCPTTLDGLRVDFDASLRLASLLPKHVRGNLWLVQEEGRWRVRPVTFSFLF